MATRLKNSTHVRMDIDTKNRLKAQAGDMPLAHYLRFLSNPGEKMPESPLDKLRKSMLKRFDKVEKAEFEFKERWFLSFLAQEKSLLRLSNAQNVIMSALDALSPGLYKQIKDMSKLQTDHTWAERLDEAGMIEINGQIQPK